MSVIISVFYPLWYNSHRSHIKDIVDTGQNVTAKAELETLVQEHETWLVELGNPKNRIYGEQLMMNHALSHLNTVINDANIGLNTNQIINQQIDIVKEALLREPKADYS